MAADEATASLPVAYFGASTGAAAALIAAAERRGTAAVVSRGGRPDLAEAALDRVDAPTLLIVGERDPLVLDVNRQALDRRSSRSSATSAGEELPLRCGQIDRKDAMGSSSKRQTTMAKMARERALQERRAQKQEKKDQRKQAAAAARDAKAAESAPSENPVDGETAGA